eukprot:COSAG01_NODE_3192_length_6435_cov_14.950284_5_plen_113_part_00
MMAAIKAQLEAKHGEQSDSSQRGLCEGGGGGGGDPLVDGSASGCRRRAAPVEGQGRPSTHARRPPRGLSWPPCVFSGPGAAANIDPALLASFASQQMVEITALQVGLLCRRA